MANKRMLPYLNICENRQNNRKLRKKSALSSLNSSSYHS